MSYDTDMHAASPQRNPLRLLHLVLTLDVGGLENLVWQMANRAGEFGLQADVACLDRGGHYADHLQPGVAVLELHRKGPLDIPAVIRLARHCVRRRIQVVHSHSGCMLYAALLGWMCPRLRIVHTDHGRHHPEQNIACIEERVACRRAGSVP